MKLINNLKLEKISDVYDPPMVASEEVAAGDWVTVYAGWVLLIFSAVFVVNGVLRLSGVVRVGHV